MVAQIKVPSVEIPERLKVRSFGRSECISFTCICITRNYAVANSLSFSLNCILSLLLSK